jgi:chromatin remodeling complex protein RSC6
MPPKKPSGPGGGSGKRRPSAYIVFTTENRESAKRELNEKGNSKPGMGDIAKLISGRWKSLTEEEKQKFKEKCEKEFDEKEERERKEKLGISAPTRTKTNTSNNNNRGKSDSSKGGETKKKSVDKPKKLSEKRMQKKREWLDKHGRVRMPEPSKALAELREEMKQAKMNNLEKVNAGKFSFLKTCPR